MASLKNTKPFDPKSISGLQLWLDAADSSTITGTTSVSQWNDKSGNARHVSQASAALRPSYSSTSNAIVFSGSPYLSIPNALAAITPSYTIFVVEKRASANVMFFIGQHSIGTANTGLILGYNATNTSHHTTAYITDCYMTIPSYAGSSESVKINRYGYSGSTRYSSINGGQYFTTQSFSATLPVWTNANIGSGFLSSTYAYIGNIHEILFFNSTLSTSNCERVEGYLAWKWGVVANLPNTHPFKQPIVPFSFSLQRTNTRVSQTFDPRSLSGCALWLDASDTTTLSLSGSNVIEWRDKSGNARNFIATEGNFTSILDGTRRVVNIPSTTYMTCIVPLTVTANVSWVFVVAKLGRTSDPPMYLMNFTPDGDESFRYHYNTGSYGGAPGAPGDGNELLTPGQSYIHGILNTATTYTNYHQINGPIQNTRTTTSITLSSPFGSRYFLGTLAEVIFFSGPITTAQRQQIEGYLARKWNLNTNLPTSHPNANPLSLAPFPYQNTPVPMRPFRPPIEYISKFTYTGSAQTYTVPANVRSISVYLWGGGGGRSSIDGGSGAFVSGTVAVTPGATYSVVIGKSGNTSGTTKGTMAQGAGGAGTYSYFGGGGFSGLFSGASLTIGALVAIAGGGGTASFFGPRGGSGGVITGGTGTSPSGGYPGTGGTQTAGGTTAGGITSTIGAQFFGGDGRLEGPGGGGGYYGGGGSDCRNLPGQLYAGSGGGSSYTGGFASILVTEDGVTPNGSTTTQPGGTTNTYYVSPYGQALQNGYVVIFAISS